jgi:hypothetical protein
MRSPSDAIKIELHNAPIPIDVSNSPCPRAPTWSKSRAKTGNSVLNGIMNNAATITIKIPVRTSGVRQLNFHLR